MITCVNVGCRNQSYSVGDMCDFCRVAKYKSAALDKESEDSPIPPDPLFGDASLNKRTVDIPVAQCVLCKKLFKDIGPVKQSLCPSCIGDAPPAKTMCGSSPTALNVEDAPRDEQLKGINQQIWEADVRLEEDAIIKAGGAMTRNDLFLIAQQMCNESLLLMRKRNVEYAPENDPLANLRVFRMVSVCQEIHNCFSRLKRFAMADLKGEDKPMTDEQVRNAENDLLNFAILFRAMRIQCAGGKQ